VNRDFNARGLGLAVVAAFALAGCSASITRFDNPSFALGEGAGGTAAKRASSAPVLEPPPRQAAQQPSSYQSPAASRGGGTVEVAGLPAIEQRSETPARALALTRQPPPAPVPPAPQVASVSTGQQIVVQQGDTLYAIGKRHKVMISDLMAANNLKNPNIKPGQKLYLPAGGAVRVTPKVKPERTAAIKAAPPSDAASEPAQQPAGQPGGNTYTVKPGDSLFAIAAKHKIKVGELQRLNQISDVSKVRPGTVLKLPEAGQSVVGSPPAKTEALHAGVSGETVQPETRIVRVAAPAPVAGGLKVLNGNDGAGGGEAAPVQVSAPATAAGGKLRWPVRGRVVQGFGARADGSHNDGIDIAVPAGVDVLAAEDGVVAYAGNEVKTYGNLVLIRHDNGWVTAYAYNERLLVQRGDRVKRGQAVAKAGKTGAADQPQVHFEVRVGSKPVDPTGYLEKL
jgi:murein DD-endopeptidase MepM/ murein hydrolase activator NlpD